MVAPHEFPGAIPDRPITGDMRPPQDVASDPIVRLQFSKQTTFVFTVCRGGSETCCEGQPVPTTTTLYVPLATVNRNSFPEAMLWVATTRSVDVDWTWTR